MAPQEGQEEPLKRLSKIVNSIMGRPESQPFHEPVDWRGLELYDYCDIIKKPMDLGTIKRRLERKQYQTAAQCAAEIRLVWKNCMTYNAEWSDFWLLARSLSKKFEDRYRKVKAEFYVGEEEAEEEEEEEEEEQSENEEEAEASGDEAGHSVGSSTRKPAPAAAGGGVGGVVPALDAKTQLAANLLLLDGPQLGHIMNTIELKCPEALEMDPLFEDRIELVVDKLTDTSVFHEISQFAADKASDHRRGVATVEIDDISNKRRRRR